MLVPLFQGFFSSGSSATTLDQGWPRFTKPLEPFWSNMFFSSCLPIMSRDHPIKSAGGLIWSDAQLRVLRYSMRDAKPCFHSECPPGNSWRIGRIAQEGCENQQRWGELTSPDKFVMGISFPDLGWNWSDLSNHQPWCKDCWVHYWVCLIIYHEWGKGLIVVSWSAMNDYMPSDFHWTTIIIINF